MLQQSGKVFRQSEHLREFPSRSLRFLLPDNLQRLKQMLAAKGVTNIAPGRQKTFPHNRDRPLQQDVALLAHHFDKTARLLQRTDQRTAHILGKPGRGGHIHGFEPRLARVSVKKLPQVMPL